MRYSIAAILLCSCIGIILSTDAAAHRGLSHRQHRLKRETDAQGASGDKLEGAETVSHEPPLSSRETPGSVQPVPMINTQPFSSSAKSKQPLPPREATATVQTIAATATTIVNASKALSSLLTSYDTFWTLAYEQCIPLEPLGVGTT